MAPSSPRIRAAKAGSAIRAPMSVGRNDAVLAERETIRIDIVPRDNLRRAARRRTLVAPARVRQNAEVVRV